jgi:hypothetical protein
MKLVNSKYPGATDHSVTERNGGKIENKYSIVILTFSKARLK